MDLTDQRILVAGATGTLGGLLATALHDAGPALRSRREMPMRWPPPQPDWTARPR